MFSDVYFLCIIHFLKCLVNKKMKKVKFNMTAFCNCYVVKKNNLLAETLFVN